MSKKTRIVQCARVIGPGMGVGGPAFALEREFERLGYECARFTLTDLHIEPFGAKHRLGSLTSLLRFWRDVVVFSTLGSVCIWWRYHRKQDVRTVVICHVDALVGDVFVVRAMPKANLVREGKMWWRILKNPLQGLVLVRDEYRFRSEVHRKIVVLSQSNAEELMQLYPVANDSIEIIPNGVDCDRFQPSSKKKTEIRSELGIPEHAFVLVFVANEFERKGLRSLISAIKIVSGLAPRCRLIIAGSDQLEAFEGDLNGIEPLVHFVGHRSDIEAIYAAGDAFILPTKHDITPLVGLEAMAAGLPLLMTRIGGAKDYLRDGDNGYFISEDPADIAEKIERLMDNPVVTKEMAQNAHRDSRQYRWEVVAKRYGELIDRIVSERESVNMPGNGQMS